MKKILAAGAAMVAMCALLTVASSAETLEATGEPGFFDSIAEFFERFFDLFADISSPFRIFKNWIESILIR